MRRSQGQAPRPVLEAAASHKRSAPGGQSLPELPPGCRWGYCTPDRMFVPFDLATHIQGDALQVGLVDSAPPPLAAGATLPFTTPPQQRPTAPAHGRTVIPLRRCMH